MNLIQYSELIKKEISHVFNSYSSEKALDGISDILHINGSISRIESELVRNGFEFNKEEENSKRVYVNSVLKAYIKPVNGYCKVNVFPK
jgi:hypothetical protein